jgi:hypothetical protein
LLREWYDSGWAKIEQREDEPIPEGLIVKLTTLADDIVEDALDHEANPRDDERQDRTSPRIIHKKPGESG